MKYVKSLVSTGKKAIVPSAALFGVGAVVNFALKQVDDPKIKSYVSLGAGATAVLASPLLMRKMPLLSLGVAMYGLWNLGTSIVGLVDKTGAFKKQQDEGRDVAVSAARRLVGMAGASRVPSGGGVGRLTSDNRMREEVVLGAR